MLTYCQHADNTIAENATRTEEFTYYRWCVGHSGGDLCPRRNAGAKGAGDAKDNRAEWRAVRAGG